MPRVTFAAATNSPEHEVGSPVSPTKVDDGDRTAPQSPTPATSIVSTTIVDDAQECLAQSNLMFLYADLRLLSATGRINTKFESLCIDSDRVPKTTSAEMAQLEGTRLPRDVASTNDSCGGVSPVQIMAILFVELRQEVIAQRRRIKEQLKKDKGWVPKSLTANEDDEDDEIDDDGGLLKTITDSQGRRRLEMDMHANIRAYNDMLAHDLKGMPEVQLENIVQHAIWRHWSERRRSKVPLVRQSRFARSFDAAEQPTNEFDDEESKNSSSSAPGRFHMSSIFGGSSPSVMHGSPGRFNLSAIFGASSPNARRSNQFHLHTIEDSEPPILTSGMDTPRLPKSESNLEGEIEMIHQSELNGNKGCVEGTRTTNPGHGNGTDPALMKSSMQGRYDALEKQLTTFVNKVKEDRALHHQLNDYEAFAGAENVGNKVLTMTSRINRVPGLSSQPGRNMSENELLDFMTKCIESRDSHSLDFMAEFFKDDTVAQAMVKSEAQFVWLQDWFPIKDCIYAISVDMKKKRVVVVFRGAITRADWSHGFDAKTKRCENPVSDSYVGKGEYLRVHRGFYQYLFRVRKDTSTTKYDEIATKVHEYGNKMIGSDFTVAVNGYSLGGALSLLFGFFASTDNRFTQNGPVKIFTYGMPLMASNSFADAFRHQEKRRKVQHARFFNNNDIVPYIPLNLKPTKRGSRFVHVGIDVRLYPVSRFLRGNRHPHIHYNDRESAMGAYWRALKNNAILKMPFPWRIKHVHSLPEHRKRLARAVSKAEADKATKPFLHSTLDEAYEAMVYKKGD